MSDPKGHTIQVVSGPAGPSLYLDDYRIAGPKPWGGGTVLYEFAFKDKDLTAAGVTLDPRPAPDAALDVERLANATARVVGWTGALDYHREWAEKVAREYAALAPADREEEL